MVMIHLCLDQKAVDRSLVRPHDVWQTNFSLDGWTDEELPRHFRFRKDHVGPVTEIRSLFSWLLFANRFGHRARPVEATAIMLRRLTNFPRWRDIELVFCIRRSSVSEIYLGAIHHHHSILFPFPSKLVSEMFKNRAAYNSAKIFGKGASLNNCIEFIDGTSGSISRPLRGQSSFNGGHKQAHVPKYQTAMAPEELLLRVYRPVEGRRHDLTIRKERGMENALAQELVIENTP